MALRSAMLVSTALVVLLLVLTGGALAVGFGLIETGGGDQSGGAIGDSAPFEAPTGAATVVDPARIVVEASTYLPPAADVSYEPANTIDGDPSTAWNSDSPEFDGRGERLTFRLSEPVDLKALSLVNGYAKNDAIFAANHRLRSVAVHTDGSTRMLSLVDTADPQQISFDFGLTSKVVLEVVDVYAGSGFADPELSADLAVSEVSFLAVQR